MHLLKLPNEILDLIIDLVIKVPKGWNKYRSPYTMAHIREARLVCKRFDSITTRQASRRVDWQWWRFEMPINKGLMSWLLHDQLLLEAEKETYNISQGAQDLTESSKEAHISDAEIKSILYATDSLRNACQLTFHYQDSHAVYRQMGHPNSGPWLPRIFGARLSISAFCGDETLVRRLLDRGDDVNASDKCFGPPLYAVVAMGNNRMAELLLSHGADPNCIGDRGSPLVVATRDANEELVRLLLRCPTIDLNLTARALFYSCDSGNVAITRQILNHAKSVYNVGTYWIDSPFRAAAYRGYAEITKLFVCQDDLNEPVSKGIETALWQAAAYDRTDCFRSLLGSLDQDADLDGYKRNGDTLLWWAAFWGHLSIARAYLEHMNVDINAAGVKGDTPLWQASYRGRKDIVSLLLQKGDVALNEPCSTNRYPYDQFGGRDLENTFDHTPLSIAAAADHPLVVELLLTQPDIEVNCRDSRDRTPLVAACQYGHEEVVKALLQCDKLDVKIEDRRNRTAAQMATLMLRVNILSLIVARYPDTLNTQNSQGYRCSNYRTHDTEMNQKLEELGAIHEGELLYSDCVWFG